MDHEVELQKNGTPVLQTNSIPFDVQGERTFTMAPKALSTKWTY